MTTPRLPAAALAGVPAGVQAQGIWAGRRQLFVRFAGEAETATMYTSTALLKEIDRQLGRTKVHSIVIGGRDPLGNLEFLMAAFGDREMPVPLMLDSDGQRPEALAMLAPNLAMTQATVEFVGPEAARSSAIETIAAAAGAGCAHALVLCPRDDTSDPQILRLIEQAHATSAETHVVIHPFLTGEPPVLDRRWSTLLEQAAALHADTRLALRLPPPTGLR
jgi:organic radical activating enzyme